MRRFKTSSRTRWGFILRRSGSMRICSTVAVIRVGMAMGILGYISILSWTSMYLSLSQNLCIINLVNPVTCHLGEIAKRMSNCRDSRRLHRMTIETEAIMPMQGNRHRPRQTSNRHREIRIGTIWMPSAIVPVSRDYWNKTEDWRSHSRHCISYGKGSRSRTSWSSRST